MDWIDADILTTFAYIFAFTICCQTALLPKSLSGKIDGKAANNNNVYVWNTLRRLQKSKQPKTPAPGRRLLLALEAGVCDCFDFCNLRALWKA